ncbi:hypothetical protein NMG60_11009413 [Bertholletia excelsa]
MGTCNLSLSFSMTKYCHACQQQHWEGILGAAWNNKYWGRKAMMIKDIKKLQRMKVKDTSSGTSTSKITSNYSSLEHEKEKDKNVHQSEEVDAQGFVAFNADYRGPRHHPPKNN